MYAITTNGANGTAGTIPDALAVCTGQLRTALLAGAVRWTITDPTDIDHSGHIDLNGRLDLLNSSVSELCEDLYPQLHRAADGYRGV